jgi:hypothetical protein
MSNQMSNQLFYNQQDAGGGILIYHNNATREDFDKKCAEFDIPRLTWRCFGKDAVFFYKRNVEEEDDEDEDDDEDYSDEE